MKFHKFGKCDCGEILCDFSGIFAKTQKNLTKKRLNWLMLVAYFGIFGRSSSRCHKDCSYSSFKMRNVSTPTKRRCVETFHQSSKPLRKLPQIVCSIQRKTQCKNCTWFMNFSSRAASEIDNFWLQPTAVLNTTSFRWAQNQGSSDRIEASSSIFSRFFRNQRADSGN